MELNDVKINVYSRPVSSLSNNPTQDGMTAEELKAWFDNNANDEIKTAINALIDFVTALTNGEEIKGIRINEDNAFEVTADGVSWKEVGKNGHVIVDKDNVKYAARDKLKFLNGAVTEDNEETKVEIIIECIKEIRIKDDNTMEMLDNNDTWNTIGTNGHVIVDKNGTEHEGKRKLKFLNGDVAENGDTTTVLVEVGGPEGVFAVKDTDGVSGNIAVLDDNGNAVDGGMKFSVTEDGILEVTY